MPTTGPKSKNFKSRFIVKRVKLTFGQDLGQRQLELGYAGIIKGISVDYVAGANASGVVTIKENNSSGATLWTSGATATDTTGASTGQLLVPATDGLSITNTATTNPVGLYFATGLHLKYTLATAGNYCVVRLLIDTGVVYRKATPAHTGTLTDGNVTGSDEVYLGRPGILRAIRVSASAGATADLTIKVDADSASSIGGATVFTATDFGTSAIVSGSTAGTPASINSPGLDEANGAVTTPSGGGMPFLHGIKASLAQCNVADAITIEYWIEV